MSIRVSAVIAAGLSCLVAACTQTSDIFDDIATSSIAEPVAHTAKNRDCMARAMFFESHRSSREGLVAVGTVVMNRVNSDDYPDTICGVVGQKNQFAPGVLTRSMNSKALPDVMAAADAVLAGERHPDIHTAKFFHQAGLSFPYGNMHYVLQAGGNSFYERKKRGEPVQPQSAIANAKSSYIAPAAATALAYDVEQDQVDAIGALIVKQQNSALTD